MKTTYVIDGYVFFSRQKAIEYLISKGVIIVSDANGRPLARN